MASPDRLSIRQRLLLWLLPSVAVLTVVWIVAIYSIALHFSGRIYDWALEDTARTIAGQVSVGLGGIRINLPAAATRMLEYDDQDQIYFSVTDTLGRKLAGNRLLPGAPAETPVAAGVGFYDGDADGVRLRIVEYRPASVGADGFAVRVAETLHKRKGQARSILGLVLGVQLIFLLGIVLIVWYGVGRGIEPLDRVRDAIARRTHEDLRPLDEQGLPVEVRQQVHVINDLMSRLDRAMSVQRQFLADATHQLRTPITVLRTQAELALRAREPVQLRQTLEQLDKATRRLARLANQLLSLSRAESGVVNPAMFAHVPVAEIVEDTVAGLVPAALARQIDIRIDIADASSMVRADRQSLAEMLSNLIDNAIRYVPPGGRIVVTAQQTDKEVVLIVADDGPGIPEPERKRVLERFYRGATAGSEGSGLGLAIAHEIATLHGGRMRLTSPPQARGLSVVIELPR